MAGIYSLKYRDTRPILEAALKNPDGTAFDLTGATSWKLQIKLADGSALSRDMVVQGTATAGVLRYTPIATDWNVSSGGGTVGGFVVGEHRIEFEVIGPSTARSTFPNTGYDVMRIVADIGQG